MKLSSKVFINVVSLVIIYSCFMFICTALLISPQFEEIERTLAKEDFLRIQNGLDHEIENLTDVLKGYAQWDDTYTYIAGDYIEDYLNENYSKEYLQTINIDAVFIIDKNGKVVFATAINPETNESVDFTKLIGFSDALPHDPVTETDPSKYIGKSGFLNTPLGIMIFSKQGISNNSNTAPIIGKIIFARFFGKIDAEILSNLLSVKLTISQDAELIKTSLTANNTLENKATNEDNINVIIQKNNTIVRKVIYDFLNNPIAVIETTRSRTVTEQGAVALQLIAWITLFFGLMITLSVLYVLNGNVLKPIINLTEASKKIAITNDFMSRLPEQKSNEIGDFANAFNSLLDSLSSLNANLDQRVRERTIDLLVANNNLKLMAKVFENSLEGIVITDKDANIINVNPAFTRITGYTLEDVKGKNPRILKSDMHDAIFYKNIWSSILQEGKWSGEIWNKNKLGHTYPEWMTLSRIINEVGETSHFVSVFHDISDIKKKEEVIQHQAYHDPLTGLPNRLYFKEHIKSAIARTERAEKKLALLYMDLDHFKEVNDSMGHSAGDDVLVETGRRLKALLRQGDTVARLGGDEFTVILEEIESKENAILLAKRIISSITIPFIVKDESFKIGISIGVAIFPDHSTNSSVLIQCADSAMYQAKLEGRNDFRVFTVDHCNKENPLFDINACEDLDTVENNTEARINTRYAEEEKKPHIL